MAKPRKRTKPAGRKPRPPQLTKRNIVSVGFDDDEIKRVKQAARDVVMPVSQYARVAVLRWIEYMNSWN